MSVIPETRAELFLIRNVTQGSFGKMGRVRLSWGGLSLGDMEACSFSSPTSWLNAQLSRASAESCAWGGWGYESTNVSLCGNPGRRLIAGELS